jgi:hypothetical protein
MKGIIGGKISSTNREEDKEEKGKRKCSWFSPCQPKLKN